MIKITKQDGTFVIVSDDKAAHICLELAGGGFNEVQTRSAMLMADRLRQGEVVRRGGFKVEMLEVVE